MTALIKVESINQPMTLQFDESQIELLKTTICKGSSNEELKFFIYACQRSGLDPFARQIYSVPRGGQRVIQTSVDGFRVIADRTGRYAPGREPDFKYGENGNLISAIAYVKKQTKDGTWHEISASARFDEYDGKNNFWKTKPHIMLSKCAECLALRKAFPAEMSGIYGKEEMDQAEIVHEKNFDVKPLYIEKLSMEQTIMLQALLNSCSPEYREQVKGFIPKKYKVEILDEVPSSEFDKLKTAFEGKAKDYQAQLSEDKMNITNVEVE